MQTISYCRWSKDLDEVPCDLYCFESGDDWTTYVAGYRLKPGYRRYEGDFFAKGKEEKYAKWCMENIDPINLPYAGESFSDPTLEAFKERLLMLRALGYLFPDHALERIEKELIAEQKDSVME